MAAIKLSLRNNTKKILESLLQQAKYKGDVHTITKVLVIFAVATAKYTYELISKLFRVSVEFIRLLVINFIINGIKALKPKKSPGRKPKLTKSQKKELKKLIIAGPAACGFPGACWRSPMIQTLIYEKYGVYYAVNYIAQLLKNMGFTYQKAKFVTEEKDAAKRKEWIGQRWPEIKRLAEEKNAYILFGDEASFPQWGSLSYTWGLRGHQPTAPTSGKRKGYKVFGLIDYLTGKFFYKAHEDRLNSDSYQFFLSGVLAKTRKHIILIQDGARYHTSKAMNLFFQQHADRLTVYQLPTYSPDYNPIEALWKKMKQNYTHLHYFPTFESLMKKVDEALLEFENLKEEVLALFGLYEKIAA
jgi:transposase